MEPRQFPEVMCMKEAADFLGVSTDALYQYVKKKKVPSFRLGNRWKFSKTALVNWMLRISGTGGKIGGGIGEGQF
jgi:excisionase family DNA binding protein